MLPDLDMIWVLIITYWDRSFIFILSFTFLADKTMMNVKRRRIRLVEESDQSISDDETKFNASLLTMPIPPKTLNLCEKTSTQGEYIKPRK